MRKTVRNPRIRNLHEEKEELTNSLLERREEIERLEKLQQKIAESKQRKTTTVWLPKVFCVFSPYLYYDKYVDIIQRHVQDLQDHTRGLTNLLEALVFELVCKLEMPSVRKTEYRGV